MFDFSLSVGDTLFSYYNFCGDLIVDSIGTINLFNSETRKIFFLNNYEYFIEGLGGSQGFMNPQCQAIGSWNQQCCVLINGVAIYDFLCGSCFQVMKIERHESSSYITIYPNPTSDFLNIEINKPEEPGAITLTDITGRVVLQSTFTSRIDVSHLPKGMYLLSVYTNTEKFVRKIIVH